MSFIGQPGRQSLVELAFRASGSCSPVSRWTPLYHDETRTLSPGSFSIGRKARSISELRRLISTRKAVCGSGSAIIVAVVVIAV